MPAREGLSEAIFQRNLDALAEVQPMVAERLRSVAPCAVGVARSGEPTCQFTWGTTTRWLHSAYQPSAEATRLAQLVPSRARSVMVIGCGLGYLPALLVHERSDRAVVVVEPEPRFVSAMLRLFDVSRPISDGRLQFLIDDGDKSALGRIGDEAFVLVLPSLQDAYADRQRHVRYLRGSVAARRGIIAVDYKLYLADVAELFEAEGYAVRVVEPNEISIATLRHLCGAIQPALLFSINFSPELALLSTHFGVPYASWTIDPLPASRLRLHPGTDSSLCLVYAHSRDLVADLRRVGLDAQYLPLAAGKRRMPIRDESRLARYRCPVSFAGVSLAVENEALLRRLRQLGGDDALHTRVERWLDQRFAQIADAYDFRGLAPEGTDVPDWLLAALVGADAVEWSDRLNGALAHRLRRHRVELLRPHGIHVWGDEGWERYGDSYRGRAEHGDPLTLIYNASRVNLDVPRVYQRDIATMRVFDILACGGVLLTEPTPQLLELFREDEHLFTYRSDAEMIERVQQLNQDPERARVVAERGRELAVREHLLIHRVRVILADAERRGFV